MTSDESPVATRESRACPTPVLVGLTLIAGSVGAMNAFDSLGRAFAWTLGLFAVGTVGVLLVARSIWSGAFAPGFRGALGLTIALQLLALPLEPTLSDDVYRYVWEGRVGLAGENPYLHAPTSTELAPLRDDEIWPRINHPDIPAAYPPFLQAALRLGVRISADPLGQKIVFGATWVFAFVLFWRLLERHRQKPQLALILGVSPLGAVEFAGMGHSDSLTLAMVCGALLANRDRRGALAGVLLAFATGTKFLPIGLLPFFVRRNGLRTALPFAVTMVALYAPWVPFDDPSRAFAGARAYAAFEPTGGSGFPIVSRILEEIRSASWPTDVVDPARVRTDAIDQAKVFFLVVGLILFVRALRRRISAERFALWLALLFVVGSPIIHPWYVAAFLLPLAALRRSPLLVAATGSVVGLYHVLPQWLDRGVWEQSVRWSVFAWAPLWFWMVFRSHGERRISSAAWLSRARRRSHGARRRGRH